MEETFERIDQCAKRDGPFDGILGFSQGASLAALLCRRRSASFRFAILVSGFVPQDPAFESYFEGSGGAGGDGGVGDHGDGVGEGEGGDAVRQMRSLHVYGLADERVPHATSRRLAKCFAQATHFPWEGGHAIPSGAAFRGALREFIAASVGDGQKARRAADRPACGEEGAQQEATEVGKKQAAAAHEVDQAERCVRSYIAWQVIRGGSAS